MGHTTTSPTPWARETVHPHLRGAYCSAATCSGVLPGSSPHTWGIHHSHDTLDICPRFIPTYVGHTKLLAEMTGAQAVHPHIRGAYISSYTHTTISSGSSPHTWGILEIGSQKIFKFRFIPTYVGHTWNPCRRVSARTVHPHIRGAYGAPSLRRLSPRGSSPHTWGILWKKFSGKR